MKEKEKKKSNWRQRASEKKHNANPADKDYLKS